MKLLLTITLAAVVSLTCSAQIVPKSRVIGVSLAARSQYFPNAPTNYSSSSLSFQPSFGKFLNEKWLFSAGPDYFYSTSILNQFVTTSRLSTHTVGLNAGMTRFVPMFDKLYFTIGGNIYSRMSFAKNEITDFDGITSTSRDEANNTGLIVSPGFAYYVNQKWMLTANFGHLNYDVIFNGNNSIIHNLNLNLSTNSLGFGFRYVLGAKN